MTRNTFKMKKIDTRENYIIIVKNSDGLCYVFRFQCIRGFDDVMKWIERKSKEWKAWEFSYVDDDVVEDAEFFIDRVLKNKPLILKKFTDACNIDWEGEEDEDDHSRK